MPSASTLRASQLRLLLRIPGMASVPDFVQSLRSVFQTSVSKPNLWICAFALVQGDRQLLENQVSGAATLAESPFVQALAQAKQFVVVRNSRSDLYSRIWCVCELLFATSFALVPNQTYVTGPDVFANCKTSCLDAQSTEPHDKARILKYLLNQHQYQEIDQMVHVFRTQQAPTQIIMPPPRNSMPSLATVQTSASVNSLAWSPHGLVAALADASLLCFECSQGTVKVKHLHPNYTPVIDVVYSDQMVISGSKDGSVRVFEAQTGSCSMILNGHTAAVNTLAISQDAVTLASGSSDKTIRRWSLSTGVCKAVIGNERVGLIPFEVHDLFFSLEGTNVICRSINKRRTQVWRIDPVEQRSRGLGICSDPPKQFNAFVLDRGIVGARNKYVAPDGQMVGLQSRRILWLDEANPCIVFRDGSVTFFRRLIRNE